MGMTPDEYRERYEALKHWFGIKPHGDQTGLLVPTEVPVSLEEIAYILYVYDVDRPESKAHIEREVYAYVQIHGTPRQHWLVNPHHRCPGDEEGELEARLARLKRIRQRVIDLYGWTIED